MSVPNYMLRSSLAVNGPKHGDSNQPAGVHECRQAPLEKEIREECMLLADFLVEKNRAYGNSVGEPCGIFAKRMDTLAQMDCRIDDKLNRLMRGSEFPGDDTVLDLTGYLVMRRIVAAKQKKDGEQ